MGAVAATAVHLALCVVAGRPVLLVRPAPVVGADGRHVAHRWAPSLRIVDRCADRAGRAAGGAHPAAYPQARARTPAAGADAAGRGRSSRTCWPGVLIIATAIAEIWVSLDTGGPWLFGVYGAAAAIAILGAAGVLPGVHRRAAGQGAEAEEREEEERQRQPKRTRPTKCQPTRPRQPTRPKRRQQSKRRRSSRTSSRPRCRPKPSQNLSLTKTPVAACATSVRPERRTIGCVGATRAASRSTIKQSARGGFSRRFSAIKLAQPGSQLRSVADAEFAVGVG